MMLNLFNIFDPATSECWEFNWLSLFIPMIFISSNFWFFPSRLNYFLSMILMFLKKEFQMLLHKSHWMNNLFFLSLFYLITMLNFMGLIPYIFTPTSHLSICLSLSLCFWFTLMLYKWIFFNKYMFAHLTPLNTPNLLLPFMVMIETISNIIRPFTLAIRLTANMIAGHLLLCLIGSASIPNMWIIIFIFQTILMTLEISVSLIQAYVFSMLSTLYMND